jgi:hypothetical protein
MRIARSLVFVLPCTWWWAGALTFVRVGIEPGTHLLAYLLTVVGAIPCAVPSVPLLNNSRGIIPTDAALQLVARRWSR